MIGHEKLPSRGGLIILEPTPPSPLALLHRYRRPFANQRWLHVPSSAHPPLSQDPVAELNNLL